MVISVEQTLLVYLDPVQRKQHPLLESPTATPVLRCFAR